MIPTHVAQNLLPARHWRVLAFVSWFICAVSGLVGVALVRDDAARQYALIDILLEIRHSDAMTNDTQLKTAFATLQQNRDIAQVNLLNQDDIKQLLSPWMSDISADDLSGSKLMRVMIHPNANMSQMAAYLTELPQHIPGVVIADRYLTTMIQKQQAAYIKMYQAWGAMTLWLLLCAGLMYAVCRAVKPSAMHMIQYIRFGLEPQRLQSALWRFYATDALLAAALVIVPLITWQISMQQTIAIYLLPSLLAIAGVTLFWQVRCMVKG